MELEGVTTCSIEPIHTGSSKVDIFLELFEACDGSVVGQIEYDSSLWLHSSIQAMSSAFSVSLRLLEALISFTFKCFPCGCLCSPQLYPLTTQSFMGLPSWLVSLKVMGCQGACCSCFPAQDSMLQPTVLLQVLSTPTTARCGPLCTHHCIQTVASQQLRTAVLGHHAKFCLNTASVHLWLLLQACQLVNCVVSA